MKRTIVANSFINVPGYGDYFYMKAATGSLLITVEAMLGGRSDYDIDDQRTFQIEVKGGIRSIKIADTSGSANDVTYFTGVGKFIPSDDGQLVKIDRDSSSVTVHNSPGDPLYVELAEHVLIEPGDDPIIVKTGVSPLAVVFAAPTTLVPAAAFTGLTTGYVVAANPARRRGLLKALKANTGIGWIGTAAGNGYALEAGENIIIEATATFMIYATVAGDTFTFTEEQ